MHKATAITAGSANQRPNTPCIRLWIDVTFQGLEDSYTQNVRENYSIKRNIQLTEEQKILETICLFLYTNTILCFSVEYVIAYLDHIYF